MTITLPVNAQTIAKKTLIFVGVSGEQELGPAAREDTHD